MDLPYILRPVRETDLDQLKALVRQIAGGMTSLPDHRDHLSDRIDDSLRAFDPRIRKPGGEVYLFVLEDLSTQSIIGTSGIISRVGGFDPFYTYKVNSQLQEYEPLNIHNNLFTLELQRNHKGPSEICSLFLHPDFRKNKMGRLLSLARFCFMKAFPERFDTSVIAELRGLIDDEGKSPFWEAVGKNFFWKDYYEADVLSGIGEKDFIEALMPQHPIYINLLPVSAREVIGKVHPQSQPAKGILLKEGFVETNEVDIFDAGPLVQADRESLNTWKATKSATIVAGGVDEASGTTALLSNGALDFRATIATVAVDKQGRLNVDPETVKALDLEDGSEIQYMLF
jgi:arginine N-succinyltransferase